MKKITKSHNAYKFLMCFLYAGGVCGFWVFLAGGGDVCFFYCCGDFVCCCLICLNLLGVSEKEKLESLFMLVIHNSVYMERKGVLFLCRMILQLFD